MRFSLSVCLLLLVPGWARADDPAQRVAGRSAQGAEVVRPEAGTDPLRGFDSAALERAFATQLGELLDRSVERAVDGAMRALEARESTRLAAELDRSSDRKVEARTVAGPADATYSGPAGAMRARRPTTVIPASWD